MRFARIAAAFAIAALMMPATAVADEEWNGDGTTCMSGEEFMFQGVVEYGGRLETWYSSNVAYHYMTPEWTVDEEGFYRDSEGRYVVAASDYELGSVIETSRGEAVVLDCGCDCGITDFYVDWS